MPQPRDLNSDVRVTCEVICANFSLSMYGILEFNVPLDIGHFGDGGLPRSLCSRLRPDVRDTSDSITALLLIM